MGCFQWPSGLQYTGGFKENKMEGHGELTWPDQSRYEGHFHNDMREGYGKHTWTESGEVGHKRMWEAAAVFLFVCLFVFAVACYIVVKYH